MIDATQNQEYLEAPSVQGTLKGEDGIQIQGVFSVDYPLISGTPPLIGFVNLNINNSFSVKLMVFDDMGNVVDQKVQTYCLLFIFWLSIYSFLFLSIERILSSRKVEDTIGSYKNQLLFEIIDEFKCKW